MFTNLNGNRMPIHVEASGDKKLVTVCMHESDTGAVSPVSHCPAMGPLERQSGWGNKTLRMARKLSTDRCLVDPGLQACHVSLVCLLIIASPGGKSSTLF